MESNTTEELQIVKEVEINKVPVNNLESSSFYGIGLAIILIVLVTLIIKFKRKKDFVPITTKEQYYKQRENLLDYYLENKDWNMIKELLKDSSCSIEVHNRAKKALQDAGEL